MTAAEDVSLDDLRALPEQQRDRLFGMKAAYESVLMMAEALGREVQSEPPMTDTEIDAVRTFAQAAVAAGAEAMRDAIREYKGAPR